MKDDKKQEKNLDGEDDVTLESTSEEGESAALGDKLKALREKLKACESERGEYLAGWQRAKADLINWKRDAELSKKEILEFANSKLIDELLPVLESFELAFGNK